MNRFLICFGLLLTLAHSIVAQEFDEPYSAWPEDLKINGQIIINHGLDDFESARSFLRRSTADKSIVAFEPISQDEAAASSSLLQELREGVSDDGSLTIIQSKEPSAAILSAALESAGVVSIGGTVGQSETVKQLGSEFSRFIDRGGVLIADSSWAACLGKCYFPKSTAERSEVDIDGDVDDVEPIEGMSLLPDCILSFESGRPSNIINLFDELSDQAPAVDVSMTPSTMLILSGRKMFCFGPGRATFCLPPTKELEPRTESITERTSRAQAPWDTLIDLTEWRRDATDRTMDPFPPAKPRTPFVKNGTLLIVGGGGMPRGLMDRFVELAGGPEKAKLVYVPCSESDSVGERQRTVQQWKAMGVRNATFIHTKDRKLANEDDTFLEPLRDATGIWFGGGRQWNFADSYYGTTAHKLMKEVVTRGGVIGGSSAGASIQARYLARATPIGNTRIMAPGYERGGLGFISGVAIDQHFSQRGRQKDMTQLMKRHPQLLGIGLDEATAIEVQESQAKVVGRGRVFFYNREIPVEEGQPDYIALPAGSTYDLAKREVIVDASEKPEDSEDSEDSEP